jgi:hypothetical protein
VIVSVMEVRIVGVPVRDRRVPVAVRMRLARRITGGVFVLVMQVVEQHRTDHAAGEDDEREDR